MVLERSAGAVVYRGSGKEREYLILQSVKNSHWGFPKGHLEGSENAQRAAIREVFEESGLQPKFDFGFVRHTQYLLPSKNSKRVTYFIAQTTSDARAVLQRSEIKAGKWVSFDEAKSYLTEHGKMGVLQAAVRYLARKKYTRKND